MTTPADPAAPGPSTRRPLSAADVSLPPLSDPTAPVQENVQLLDAAPAAPEQNVNRAAGGNALWTMGGFVAMQVIRFASNLLLTRLLFPEVFGVMTLVNTILQGIQMFTDIGIGPSLVQNKRGEEPNFLNTAWTMMVVRGGFLWLLAMIAAFPLHWFYREYKPPLYLVLPAVALTAAIAGFESTSIYTLQRRLLRARKVILEVGTYLLTMTLTIGGCYLLSRHYQQNLHEGNSLIFSGWAGGGPVAGVGAWRPADFLVGAVWILVASNLFSTIINVTVSHFLIRDYRNRFHFDRQSFHELFHFGKWVFISTLFTFLAMQSDKFIVGKFGDKDLGIYAVAINLAMIPGQLLNTVGWQLVFPMYSRLHQAGQEIRSTFQRLHPLAGGFAAFMVAGLVAAGPALVHFLYDTRYHEAGWMLQIMAVGVWFQSLEVLECSILWTQGDTKSPTLSNVIKVAALVACVPAGIYFNGLYGMLWGFVLADAVRYLFTMLAARKRGLTIIPYDAAMTAMVVVSGYVGFKLGRLVPDPEAGAELGKLNLQFGFQALVAGGFVVLFWAVPAFVCWKKGMLRVARSG